ncbi:dehydrogenase O alpha subunit [Mycobacterium ulcerans subsp. shinshuense]|uniref:Dehydrogenase O alpha subunit n=1 Tax=Mycobacterium ulcerans subsp. shinshuense TaxID=1124626 RepID=A0A1B4XXU8_MYCUL|nr:dehydrogenase O alpha subunit [Mycobacterium ulcerans subsp. shinshuense]
MPQGIRQQAARHRCATGNHGALPAPYATEWQDLDLGTAMDMVADRVLDARSKGWQDFDADRHTLRRTLGIASLGGATLDNEENYLIKKLFTALGVLQIENQARI